jgi:hypothetical protein
LAACGLLRETSGGAEIPDLTHLVYASLIKQFKAKCNTIYKMTEYQLSVIATEHLERDKAVMELKDMQERYQREVSNLERENENLHRKLNSTFNSALM